MDLELKDKVVMVAGRATEIGAAILRACVTEGAIAVMIDDTGTPEGCARSVEQTLKRHGRIDALVNHAGGSEKISLELGSPQEYFESLERNLLPYYNLTHYALPYLKHSHGAIVNVDSKGAQTTDAIMALTREWAVELLPYGIRVNTLVASGKQLVTPEEIAATVVFLISNKSSHTTGQHLFVNRSSSNPSGALA